MVGKHGGTDDFQLYRYKPSLPAAVIFIVLFAVTTFFHVFQCWKHRSLFMIALIVGGTFEFVGYAGRAVSAHNTQSLNPYIIQTILILLGPSLFAATIYMILGRLIRRVDGEKYSPIRATWLTKIFVLGDVLSFLLQGGGAGIMSGANKGDAKNAQSKIDLGQKVIIVGLVLQVLFFGTFGIVAGVFHMRARKVAHIQALTVPWERCMHVLYATSVLIFIRSIFRVIEYAQGNKGYLISHEIFLYIFDSMLMLGVMVILNVSHPGELLDQRKRENPHHLLEERDVSRDPPAYQGNDTGYPPASNMPYVEGPKATTYR
ncbi:RTA1-domain-containing protein [Lophium mytilinum]|uniref:RTA1-domain-containing protein n=1 Tax=Lophium mytilinum TaxID=390894 RepID=A0A6A6QVH9_9PEZI|nr:RTA1-domain-containing protein [Lophium mytilinum]